MRAPIGCGAFLPLPNACGGWPRPSSARPVGTGMPEPVLPVPELLVAVAPVSVDVPGATAAGRLPISKWTSTGVEVNSAANSTIRASAFSFTQSITNWFGAYSRKRPSASVACKGRSHIPNSADETSASSARRQWLHKRLGPTVSSFPKARRIPEPYGLTSTGCGAILGGLVTCPQAGSGETCTGTDL